MGKPYLMVWPWFVQPYQVYFETRKFFDRETRCFINDRPPLQTLSKTHLLLQHFSCSA